MYSKRPANSMGDCLHPFPQSQNLPYRALRVITSMFYGILEVEGEEGKGANSGRGFIVSMSRKKVTASAVAYSSLVMRGAGGSGDASKNV